MLRICLVLAATLCGTAALAASIQSVPGMSSAMGPSMQQVGGTEHGTIDRLETASTSGEPAVVTASPFVQTSASIFQMPPDTAATATTERASARRGGSPRIIRAGAIGGSSSAPASQPAVVEEAPAEEIETSDDMEAGETYDEPAASPTDVPR